MAGIGVKGVWAVGLAMLLLGTTPARADGTVCQVPPAVKPFQPDKSYLREQASYINLWWSAGRPPALSFDEAFAERKRRIAALFTKIEEERRAAYTQASCLVVATKKCASTPGDYHECPMFFTPPENMGFVADTLKPVNDHFAPNGAPRLQADGGISFTNKKTGKGSTVDGFQVMAVYHETWVGSRVAAEMAQVHEFIDPLLDVELGSSGTR